MSALGIAGEVAGVAGLPIQAYGAIEGIKEQRKNRRWQIQQYLIEKAARDRAAQAEQKQQEFNNSVSLGQYGQTQANNAMDIFGAYNRTIGR